MSALKYTQVADRIRAQIAEGVLRPGEPVPSGAALARASGYSQLTCRKALRTLIKDGVLVPGTSPNARPRVAPPAAKHGEQSLADAARALSAFLASRRRAAGLTQPQLATMIGVSLTNVGHAETGRLWQSRRFWEGADKAVSANGELLALHDAYRAASVPADSPCAPAGTETEAANARRTGSTDETSPQVAVIVSGPVASVTVTWPDGTATTVYPPETPARPANDTTPANWPRGLAGWS